MLQDDALNTPEPAVLNVAQPILAVARWLRDHRGFSVIPIDHPDTTAQQDPHKIGKVPLVAWKEFQTTPPSDAQLSDWFGEDAARNLGIVTGAVSGIIAIDCDDADAVSWADEHLPPTPMKTRTARGEHRFYRHPGCPVPNKVGIRTGDVRVRIDVRGDGGYVLAPGSQHVSGTRYERVGAWPPVNELPLFEMVWLEERRAEQPESRALPTVATADVLRRARRYTANVPGAVEGQGGDVRTFALACKLVRGFDLSDSDALNILLEWNITCVPPWKTADLVAKVESARRYGSEPVGARRERQDDQRHRAAAVGLADRPTLPAASVAQTSPAASRPDQGLPLVPLRDLLGESDAPIDWVVRDRFAAGTVNIFAGKPKAGKSTLARALALAAAQGADWLGHSCSRGPVVYIAMEDQRAEVRRHFRAMHGTSEDVRFLFGAPPKDLLDQLAALAASEPIRLLIIDTAQRLFRVRDANDYALVMAAFEPVLALARTHNTCIVLLHHAGKVDRAGVDAILGSTAWAASADNVLVINRTERYRLLSSVQRIGPDLDEVIVLMDDSTGEMKLGGTRSLAERQRLVGEFIAALASARNEMTQDNLSNSVEGQSGVKKAALKDLGEHPDVIQSGSGVRNSPFRYQLRRAPSRLGDSRNSGTLVAGTYTEPEFPDSQLPLNDTNDDAYSGSALAPDDRSAAPARSAEEPESQETKP